MGKNGIKTAAEVMAMEFPQAEKDTAEIEFRRGYCNGYLAGITDGFEHRANHLMFRAMCGFFETTLNDWCDAAKEQAQRGEPVAEVEPPTFKAHRNTKP